MTYETDPAVVAARGENTAAVLNWGACDGTDTPEFRRAAYEFTLTTLTAYGRAVAIAVLTAVVEDESPRRAAERMLLVAELEAK